jgi:hypothetical protein
MEVSGFMTQLDSSHVVRLGDLNYDGHEEEVLEEERFPRRRRSMIRPKIHKENQDIKDTKLWATRKHCFVSFLDEYLAWCIGWR